MGVEGFVLVFWCIENCSNFAHLVITHPKGHFAPRFLASKLHFYAQYKHRVHTNTQTNIKQNTNTNITQNTNTRMHTNTPKIPNKIQTPEYTQIQQKDT